MWQFVYCFIESGMKTAANSTAGVPNFFLLIVPLQTMYSFAKLSSVKDLFSLIQLKMYVH